MSNRERLWPVIKRVLVALTIVESIGSLFVEGPLIPKLLTGVLPSFELNWTAVYVSVAFVGSWIMLFLLMKERIASSSPQPVRVSVALDDIIRGVGFSYSAEVDDEEATHVFVLLTLDIYSDLSHPCEFKPPRICFERKVLFWWWKKVPAADEQLRYRSFDSGQVVKKVMVRPGASRLYIDSHLFLRGRDKVTPKTHRLRVSIDAVATQLSIVVPEAAWEMPQGS